MWKHVNLWVVNAILSLDESARCFYSIKAFPNAGGQRHCQTCTQHNEPLRTHRENSGNKTAHRVNETLLLYEILEASLAIAHDNAKLKGIRACHKTFTRSFNQTHKFISKCFLYLMDFFGE